MSNEIPRLEYHYCPEPAPPPYRAESLELEAGKYYMSRDNGPAKILAVDAKGHTDGLCCVGYWVSTGEEFNCLPDGGIDEWEWATDLVEEVTEEYVFEREDWFLQEGKYYWSQCRKRIAKIVGVEVRRIGNEHKKVFENVIGEDPCIGYWLDTGEADAWTAMGKNLYKSSSDRDLELSQKPTEEHINACRGG